MENRPGVVVDIYLPDLNVIASSMLYCVTKLIMSGKIQDVISFKGRKCHPLDINQVDERSMNNSCNSKSC